MDDVNVAADRDPALQHFFDIHAIQQILARYVPAIDSANGEVVASDFMEDGVFDLGPMGVFEGREQIRAFIDRDHWPAESLARIALGGGHFLSPPMIVVDGDTALATCTSLFLIRDGDAYAMERLTAVRLELVRRGAGWLIKRRVNRLVDDSSAGIDLYREALADCARTPR